MTSPDTRHQALVRLLWASALLTILRSCWCSIGVRVGRGCTSTGYSRHSVIQACCSWCGIVVARCAPSGFGDLYTAAGAASSLLVAAAVAQAPWIIRAWALLDVVGLRRLLVLHRRRWSRPPWPRHFGCFQGSAAVAASPLGPGTLEDLFGSATLPTAGWGPTLVSDPVHTLR